MADIEGAISRLKVTVVDRSARFEDLKSFEDCWMCDLSTVLGNSRINVDTTKNSGFFLICKLSLILNLFPGHVCQIMLVVICN